MSLNPFPKLKTVRPVSANISDVTLRDFSGGLRVTDNEIALKSKYASKLINMFPDKDTSQILRFGTRAFASTDANIVNIAYFKQHIVSVLTDGTITKTDNTGTTTVIWDEGIGLALTGSPGGWNNNVTHADFSEFRGKLIVVNGQDRPVIIDSSFDVDYLQDLATGNNINTPISRYVTTVSNYLVMGGVTNDETSIYISATGTSGTWPGDDPPNDAISFDVGAYTGQSGSEIKGIGNFKNFLVIFFANFSVVLQLGSFSDGNVHEPAVIDTYTNLGTINSKTILATDTDLLFASNTGVASAEKNVFGGTLSTSILSNDLGDEYSQTIGLVASDDDKSFIVHDTLSKTIFYLFHKGDGSVKTFAMKYKDTFAKSSWAEVSGWNFTAACTSEKGRVFFAEGDKIYQYGNSVFSNEEYYADYITDVFEGNDIEFDWEMPWLDAGNRIKTKLLKKLSFDTVGTASFNFQCFVNNFYKDLNGNYDPASEMTFVAGDKEGYGNDTGGYGGGRRANDERFFGMPVRFKILKIRIHGSTKKPLRIISMSLIFARGNYNV